LVVTRLAKWNVIVELFKEPHVALMGPQVIDHSRLYPAAVASPIDRQEANPIRLPFPIVERIDMLSAVECSAD
jgi:hypothetical protein